VAAPLAALAGVVLLWAGIDAVGEVGPLDKAKLGWLVAVPLTLVVPVLAAWAGRELGAFGRPLLAALAGLGAGLAVGWPIWIEYASQCAGVGLPIPFSPIATTIAIVGLTMFVAVLAAGSALDGVRSGRVGLALAFVSAVVVFAIGSAVYVLMTASLLFGQCVARPQITP
jgi:hypothetical protein